jgi:signal transduction histidine kinase
MAYQAMLEPRYEARTNTGEMHCRINTFIGRSSLFINHNEETMLISIKQLLRSPIARKLTLSIVIFSSLITLVTTAYQLVSDYQSDVSRIDRVFSNIEAVNLEVLAASIWVIDEHLIDTQLRGLSQLPDINYISIRDDTNQEWHFGVYKKTAVIEKQYPLIYTNNEHITVGTLIVQADLNVIYDRLYDKAILILLSNAIKTFLVAGFILLLVWFNVTKHLRQLSQYCDDISLDHDFTPLDFNRKPQHDEFSLVADAVNTMQRQIRGSYQALHQSKIDLQHALEDRDRLLLLERSYKDELARQVKEQTRELEQSLQMLKRTQQVLVEKEKMAALGGLVSGVAHEINTPIGICLTAASSQLSHIEELIKLIHSDDATLEQINGILEQYQQSSQLIVSNITRASYLIQQFKSIAAEQSHEKNTVFNLSNLLRDITDSTLMIFSPQDVEITTSLDKQLQLNNNASLLSQAITNVVSNAFLHAFKDVSQAKIYINVVAEPDSIQIEIQNNGAVIPNDIVEHIFEPFFTTARHKGGVGLGLAAAFNAVTQLKGNICYVATSPLGGPMFVISVPR